MISRLTTPLGAVVALAVALLAFAAFAGSAGAASSSSASQTVRFANRTTVRLQLATTAPYDFGPVDPLSARDPAGNENTATVWSNANWRLFVRAAGPAFTESPTGSNTIPLNRLRVTGTRGMNLGANDKRIASGADQLRPHPAVRRQGQHARVELPADPDLHRRHPVSDG